MARTTKTSTTRTRTPSPVRSPTGPARGPQGEKPKLRGAASEPDVLPARNVKPNVKPPAEPAAKKTGETPSDGKTATPASGEESKVVSIDAFRKKT